MATSLGNWIKILQALTISDTTQLEKYIIRSLPNLTTLAQDIVTKSQTEQEKTIVNLQSTATYQSLTEEQRKNWQKLFLKILILLLSQQKQF